MRVKICSERDTASRFGRIAAIFAVAIATISLSGCTGSMVRSGFTIYGDNPVSKSQIADKFHHTCRRTATPVFARPSHDLVGRCGCASTALMNYGNDGQWTELRTAWMRSGTGPEFRNLVASMSHDLYDSFCRESDVVESKVPFVTLRGLQQAEKHEDEKMLLETDESSTDNQPKLPTGTFSATSEVANANMQLDASALEDPDLIKFIQRKLESLGHFPGPIDGIIGQQTRSALHEYREQQGISDTVSDQEVMSTLIY